MVITFDVNETLLDLTALDPHFERIFGDTAARQEWFGLVLRNAMTLTITGDYTDFLAVGGASLRMVADRRGAVLGDDDVAAVGATMRACPPHPDVPPALERLHAGGNRLAALTNSPAGCRGGSADQRGPGRLFDAIMSVDAVGAVQTGPGGVRERGGWVQPRTGSRPTTGMSDAGHDAYGRRGWPTTLGSSHGRMAMRARRLTREGPPGRST